MKKQLGYTIVEIFIALAIGLVLFAGVMSIFVGMRTTTEETSTYGELQENGRFAISLLSNDIMNSNFWGDYSGTLSLNSLVESPAANSLANDCIGEGLNNTSFPGNTGAFRTLWGTTVTGAANINCINDAEIGSDIIQIKRAIANPIVGGTPAGRYYITSNTSNAAIFLAGAVPALENARVWEYQHHVYYVNENAASGVPVLMQGRLTNNGMTFDPVIDGIERIRFMYGVDVNGDGMVNLFLSADDMNDNDDYWDRGSNSQILAVKIYVLARSANEDKKYDNKNTYHLGDITYTPDDNFRRLLFSTTVTLFNMRVDSWS